MDETKITSQNSEDSRQIIEDHYDIVPQFVYVDIIREAAGELLYSINEPEVSTELKQFIDRMYSNMRNVVLGKSRAGNGKNKGTEAFEDYLKLYEPLMDGETKKRVLYYFKRDNDGYGAIDPIVMDGNIEDISCDGVNIPIFVYHRKYGTMRTNVIFRDAESLNSFIVKLSSLCGRSISINDPILDGTSPDGHRIQAIYGSEISPRGSAFTFRLFRKNPFTIADLIRSGTISPEMAVYFWYMVESRSSGIAVGPPAVGKTSLLNAILAFVPENSKVFSIEETRELNFMHDNWIATVVREGQVETGFGMENLPKIDTFDLVRAAMRQRPTYLVVGEVRGDETFSLFQAMSTGHTVYSTLHADSMETLINRLESEPINVPRILTVYLNTVIIVKFVRINNKLVRRVTEIDEIEGTEEVGNGIVYNKIFEYDPVANKHRLNGQSKIFEKFKVMSRLSDNEFSMDFRARLNFLTDLSTSEHNDLSGIIDKIRKFNLRQSGQWGA
ncbi:MAG: type II/IV secretion system ATPase subunit [Thermoplasmataceae archaeon]